MNALHRSDIVIWGICTRFLTLMLPTKVSTTFTLHISLVIETFLQEKKSYFFFVRAIEGKNICFHTFLWTKAFLLSFSSIKNLICVTPIRLI